MVEIPISSRLRHSGVRNVHSSLIVDLTTTQPSRCVPEADVSLKSHFL